jgi:predicted phage terminase large subunit-like protein
LDGEIMDDAEGALWSRSMLEATRISHARVPDFRRVVVAIDPSGGSGRGNDECGIVVAGLGDDGHGYVLADLSGRYSPQGWAKRAINAYREHKADRIVVERNFGGDMCVATIRSIDPRVPVRTVHASRGKHARAEPVVALYEQGKVHHVGTLPGLEDQMCSWDPNHSNGSPDRIDALAWSVTDLMLNSSGSARVYRLPY